MLSFNKGQSIAIIKNGKYDGKILRIYDKELEDEKKKFKNNSKKYNYDEDDEEEESYINYGDPYDYINEDTIRAKKKKLSVLEMNKLRNSFLRRKEPDDEELSKIYNEFKSNLDEKMKKEIVLHDGMVIPFNEDKNKPDRFYIAGPTGSGKSTFINYFLVEQLKKIKKPIYIFSDKPEDAPLDVFKPYRIQLDDEIVNNPIEPEELKNSYVIFDDIDSISNRNVKDAVASLRDRILKKGRSSNITTIVTNHQMANYKETKTSLNECNMIVFFPKSGSTYAINYMLKVYIGLGKDQIKKIMELPSRWVCIHKQYPMYVIYSSGCYLL